MLIPDWWMQREAAWHRQWCMGWKSPSEPPKAESPVLIKAIQVHTGVNGRTFKGTTPHFAEGVWTGTEWLANLLGFERQRISTWEVIGWMEIPL